jgi:2-C-methyl-D-erythritol 4-phosphate cytidylyltransferase
MSLNRKESQMKKYALIVAGGLGNRMKTETPKQFLLLNKRPVLMHTIQQFINYNSEIKIIVVLPLQQIERWKKLCIQFNFDIKHKIVSGGSERFSSVKNGLALIEEDGIVFIHDGVRPLVSIETIQRCFNEAKEKGNAIPTMPLTESIRKVKGSESIAMDRSQYVSIQTPQVFRVLLLKKAYEQVFLSTFTDDASVLEGMGESINLVEGNIENIKITYPSDIKIAEAILADRKNNAGKQ